MADETRGSQNLEKLARLRKLRASMAKGTTQAEPAEAPLVADLQDAEPMIAMPSPEAELPETQNVSAGAVTAAAAATAASAAVASSVTSPTAEAEDTESLNAYFEALGISGDDETTASDSTVDDATIDSLLAQADMAEKAAATPMPTPFDESRELGADDLWQDPVRTDAAMETLAMGASGIAPEDASSITPEPELEAEPATEDVLGTATPDDIAAFEAESQSPAAVQTENTSFEDAFGGPAVSENVEADVEADIAAFEVQSDIPTEFDDTTAASAVAAFEAEAGEPDVIPVAQTDEDTAQADSAAKSEVTAGEAMTVTFDEERAKLLNHVAAQMDCSVDDVVITALDWYLDALFGQDGGAQTG